MEVELGAAVVSLLKVGESVEVTREVSMTMGAIGKQRKAEELKAWSELSLMLIAILAERLP